MKTFILLLFTFISHSLFCQNYKLNSKTVLFSSGSINYTEGHFEKIKRFAEFLLDHKLNFAEIKEAKKEAEFSFRQNPLRTINEISDIDEQMQQIYSITDVQTIGLVRSALLFHVYDALLREPQMPLLGRLIDKHCKVLAYDVTNTLVFTQKDVDGLLNLMEFIGKINGNTAKFSTAERNQATQQLTNNFNSLSLQEKQLMVTMGIMNDYIQTIYNKSSFTQKNQIKDELNKSFANNNNDTSSQNSSVDYSKFNNMSASSYQMMSNMMMSSHVTNMNILSNIGGSGDYWTIKNY